MDRKERSKPNRVDTGGGAFVGGNVNTHGGDFVGRDKVSVGVQQGVTVEGFARLLAELRQGLPQAGLDHDTTQVVEGDVKVAEEQAQKPKPNGAIILAKLESVTKLLTTAVTASEAAQKLLPVAQKAVQWAGTLFH